MKDFLYGLVALTALLTTIVACSDDPTLGFGTNVLTLASRMDDVNMEAGTGFEIPAEFWAQLAAAPTSAGAAAGASRGDLLPTEGWTFALMAFYASTASAIPADPYYGTYGLGFNPGPDGLETILFYLSSTGGSGGTINAGNAIYIENLLAPDLDTTVLTGSGMLSTTGGTYTNVFDECDQPNPTPPIFVLNEQQNSMWRVYLYFSGGPFEMFFPGPGETDNAGPYDLPLVEFYSGCG